jgi:hypothetical protein
LAEGVAMKPDTRKKVRWIAEGFVVALVVALLLGLLGFVLGENGDDRLWDIVGVVLVSLVVVTPAVYSLRQQHERNDETNRAVEERSKRKEEAEERRRVYEENYQREGRVLKDRILEDLRAIACGEKVRLGNEALDAAKALQMRQGENPKTLAAWAPVLEDLSAASLDPAAMQRRLDDLLYPETLEDVEALKKRVRDDLERISRGEKARLDPEALAAAKSLNEIRARDARIRCEEIEAEAEARRGAEASNKKFAAAMEEMAAASVRNILRMHGLPEDALDGLPPYEVLAHVKALRLARELESKPVEERERILRELERESEERGRRRDS